MLEVTGDIWEYPGWAVIAITTNGFVTMTGRPVLGNGVARQAGERLPWLPERLGGLLSAQGNHVHDLGCGMVSFPVEETPWSQPDLHLIARSARELRELADRKQWARIVVPRPGCGGGGLSWREVRTLLEPWFDDRFILISDKR